MKTRTLSPILAFRAWVLGSCKFANADIPSVRSLILSNPAGRKFYTLYGNTQPIKDLLKGMGFRYFEGRWSTAVDYLDQAKRQKLESLGVDTTILDEPSVQAPAMAEPEGEPGPVKAMEPASPVESQLAKMKAGVQKAIETSSGKTKEIFSYIDGVIDDLANQVDEAASTEFVKSFLAFSARFYNYSFGNQMLIWIQKPTATMVAGATDWFDKFGREVVDRNSYVWINAPIVSTTKEGQELRGRLPAGEWERVKAKHQRMFFKQVKVYDIADTKPIEGWTGPKGEKPYEPADWRQDPNEALEEITALVNAGLGFARTKGIDVDTEEMEKSLGGYSAGGKVRINNAYEGINKFSTLVHEMAHEILHQSEEYKSKVGREEGRQQREVDAETVAYVVLKRYGFETKDAPRYLALWRAKGEDVRKRRDNITKAVKEIVRGIDSSMQRAGIALEDGVEEEPKE
jgi:hypothetical protein